MLMMIFSVKGKSKLGLKRHAQLTRVTVSSMGMAEEHDGSMLEKTLRLHDGSRGPLSPGLVHRAAPATRRH